jgi:biotin carboxyl carrier protein
VSGTFVTWIDGREARVEVVSDGVEGVVAIVWVGDEPREVRFERRERQGGALTLGFADGRHTAAEVRPAGPAVWQVGIAGHWVEVRAVTEMEAWLGASDALADEREISVRMPGRVVKLLVAAGERVEVGKTLLIIEAMKMENEVRAPRAGIVNAVHVSVGDSVQAGEPLLELGDGEPG